MSASSFYMMQKKNTSNLEILFQERNLTLEKASELGRQYNALLPISTLPLELLLKIFHYDMVTHPGPGDPSAYLRSLSQVCHHWRNSALEAPFLWSQLVECHCLPPKWFRVVLRRARSSPLRVTVLPLHGTGGKRYFTDPNVHQALRELGNIGELDILWSDEELDEIVRPMIKHLQRPAPSLKRLTVRFADDDGDVTNIDILRLPANIFCGVTGPLQHLTLSCCMIDIKSPLYHCLTSLSMEYIPESVKPSISQFLDVLRITPNLTTLSLTWALKPSTSVGRIEGVRLSRLSSLKVAGMSAECSQFLSHLQYTALHRFELRLDQLDPEQINLSNLIKQPLSQIEPLRSCEVLMYERQIKFSSRRPGFEDEPGSALFYILLSWVPLAHIRTIFSSLITDISSWASHCEWLTLGLYPDALTVIWWDETFKCLARAFSSVKTLEIKTVEWIPVDDFLCSVSYTECEQPYSTISHDSTASKHIMLPNLRNLYMNTKKPSPYLIAFLQYRRRCGLAIETIQFPKGFDHPWFVRDVKSLCSSVTVLSSDAPVAPVQENSNTLFDNEAMEDADPELDYVAGKY
ncbi:hypothetical protein GALMADRAFT_212471 [Galerina marginata CBS 339.88]|uniref:F-box domain-containing protein n=1 Tax=Galerina marginata (strain CBS 339.88) TaxID=685588 RepID=A0A067SRW8_GALM3|nr:hypothetical protein GALMADRAFT_212471 [Galerina marginata CBS 339.88]